MNNSTVAQEILALADWFEKLPIPAKPYPNFSSAPTGLQIMLDRNHRDLIVIALRNQALLLNGESGETSFRALVQELFDFTTPVNDTAKFLVLSSTMAESGWWKRARAALARAGRG